MHSNDEMIYLALTTTDRKIESSVHSSLAAPMLLISRFFTYISSSAILLFSSRYSLFSSLSFSNMTLSFPSSSVILEIYLVFISLFWVTESAKKGTFAQYLCFSLQKFLIVGDYLVNIIVATLRIQFQSFDQFLVLQSVVNELIFVVFFLHSLYFLAAAFENLLELFKLVAVLFVDFLRISLHERITLAELLF